MESYDVRRFESYDVRYDTIKESKITYLATTLRDFKTYNYKDYGKEWHQFEDGF